MPEVKLEFIISAAIKHEDVIFSLPRPSRHYHIAHKMYDMGLPKTAQQYQGFLTTTGRFVDRKEAATLAMVNGQIVKPKFVSDELFSEDLW